MDFPVFTNTQIGRTIVAICYEKNHTEDTCIIDTEEPTPEHYEDAIPIFSMKWMPNVQTYHVTSDERVLSCWTIIVHAHATVLMHKHKRKLHLEYCGSLARIPYHVSCAIGNHIVHACDKVVTQNALWDST